LTKEFVQCYLAGMTYVQGCLPLLALLVACAEPALQLPTMSLDNMVAMADVATAASRDFVEITIDPRGATLGGETVGRLWFRLDLTRTPDCMDGTCADRRIVLDGQRATGHFVYGVLTYDIGEVSSGGAIPAGRCPFTQEGDPLQLPRGTVAGTVDFQRLDADGASLQIMLSPVFGPEFPAPNVAHLVDIAPIDVDFRH